MVSNTLVIKGNLLTTSSRLRRALTILVTYTLLVHISYACVHLDDPSKIIDDCYLEFLDTYFDMHLGGSSC